MSGPRKKKLTAPERDADDDEIDALLDSDDDPGPQVHGDGGNLELWEDATDVPAARKV